MSTGARSLIMGIVTMDGSAPQGGEVHPNGDEILSVLSGRLRVKGSSSPEDVIDLGAGEACIIRKGEWHTVEALGKTEFIHVTPGPDGDHRPR